MVFSALTFLRNQRRVLALDRASWHDEGVKVSHYEAVLGCDPLKVLEKLQGRCRRKYVIFVRLFRPLAGAQ